MDVDSLSGKFSDLIESLLIIYGDFVDEDDDFFSILSADSMFFWN